MSYSFISRLINENGDLIVFGEEVPQP